LNIDPNWLGMGAKALVLWFYGQEDNDANQKMYVTLTDGASNSAKIIYDGDMNDVREQKWHEWNIDLQGFVDSNNVDLTNVSRITIGFGNGTQAANDGTVYFEDIQLYTTRCVLSKRDPDFAKVDYAPAGNPGGDCVVNYQEIKIMADTWLDKDEIISTNNPGDSNLVVYYPLNEGGGSKVYSHPDSNHPDFCDTKWTGTFSGAGASLATPGTAGIGGTGCIYVDGTEGSRVSCGIYGQAGLGIGSGKVYPTDTNAMTLSIWVKWLGPRTWDPYLMSQSQGLIGKRGGWDDVSMVWMFECDTGASGSFGLRHYAIGDTATPDLYSPDNILNPYIGQWVHLAATYPHPSGDPCDANSYARLYLNGGQVASRPWRFSFGYDPNIFLTIGNTMDQNAETNSPESFYGYIDEVRIYNRALEPNQIGYLADTTPLDGHLWVPIWSPANVCDKEPPGYRIVNFDDITYVGKHWYGTETWPRLSLPCKIWDVGSEITGSITVQNAKPCECKTHTSSISDKDHWVDSIGYSGTPPDTIKKYSWDKEPGTNPKSGEYPNGTTGSAVDWNAPPCTGTVIIKLKADDLPDPMYGACPGEMTRDDNPKDFEGTSTVSLPQDCVAGIKSATLTANKAGVPNCSNPDACGSTGPPTNLITNILAKYNNCKWVFAVTASKDCPCAVCSDNFTQIDNGNDADVSKSNFCGIVDLFSTGNGCGRIGGILYSNSTCVQIHEDKHFSIFNDRLPAEAALLLNKDSMKDMEINCKDATTTTCQVAADARKGAINADVEAAYHKAWTWMDPVAEEALCVATARPCFENVAKSICQRAKDEPTWDAYTCAQCVAWGFIDQRTLNSSSTTGGDVTTPGEGAYTYDHGTVVNLVATADASYHFVNWTGTAVDAGKVANPNAASTTVTMNGDYTVVANFAADK
jgi:hypothetical protein